MRFVFPVLGFVFGALLVVDIYSASRPALREANLTKSSVPLEVPTTAPTHSPEMKSPPESTPAMQNQTAVESQATEEPAKIETVDQTPEEAQPAGQSAEVLAKT